MKRIIMIAMCALLALTFVACAPSEEPMTPNETVQDDPVAEIPQSEEPAEENPTEEDPTEEDPAASTEKPIVELSIKDYGVVTMELEPSVAPISVENFLKLVNEGFYDGLTFHRIIDGFMIQGGDPLGDGTGGSDETIKGEFTENGVDNTLPHTVGAVSMARSLDVDSASSQFFIVDTDAPSLDGKYACFGYVTEGMDIVHQICDDSVGTAGSNGEMPTESQPVIEYIKVVG